MVVSVNFRRRSAKPGQITTKPIAPPSAEPKVKQSASASGGGYAEVKPSPASSASAAVPYKVSKERLKQFVNLSLT